MIRQHLRRALAILSASWVTLPLLAAGAEGEPETFLGLPRWIWLWANLILFIGILYKFIGPAIQGFLVTRGKEIADNLTNAEEQRRDAQEMRASLETQIVELKAEMDQLLERAKAGGEQERERILAQAAVERQRVLAQTEEEIRMRIAQARNELTEFTAGLAADLARQRIQQEINPDDLRRLFDDNLERFERGAK